MSIFLIFPSNCSGADWVNPAIYVLPCLCQAKRKYEKIRILKCVPYCCQRLHAVSIDLFAAIIACLRNMRPKWVKPLLSFPEIFIGDFCLPKTPFDPLLQQCNGINITSTERKFPAMMDALILLSKFLFRSFCIKPIISVLNQRLADVLRKTRPGCDNDRLLIDAEFGGPNIVYFRPMAACHS